MTDARPCRTKSHADLVLEWDQLAEERHRQISSGQDLSFEYVVVPTTVRLLEGVNTVAVLDVGCGTGDFTARLAPAAKRIIGIEPSGASLAIARRMLARAPNVSFLQATLEDASTRLQGEPVSAAVAVMTLMTTPDLVAFARSLGSLLEKGSMFVATLCHPCFWPRYWGYEKEDWFSYSKEIFIDAPFVISRCSTDIRTTHVHRPLEQYVQVFSKAGFEVDTFTEPMPSAEVERLYPRPWEFPRFMGIRWMKKS